MSEEKLGIWLEEVNGIFSLLSKHPVKTQLVENQLILISAKLNVRYVQSLLTNQEVFRVVARWPGGNELFVRLGGVQAPVAFIENGQLFFVSGHAGNAMDARRFGSDLQNWFKNLTGVEFPIPNIQGQFRRLQDQVFMEGELEEAKIEGFPHMLRAANPAFGPYRICAFGGYGINSYAIYYTIRRSKVQIYSRVPFGGVYGNTERDAKNVAEVILNFEWFAEECFKNNAEVYLWYNMGCVEKFEYQGVKLNWYGTSPTRKQLEKLIEKKSSDWNYL